MVDTKPLFGYWSHRGLGNFGRLTLAATGVDFEEKRYENKEAWFEEEKKNLDHLMPSIPYLTFDGVTITENDSICRVVADRYKPELLGTSATEKALVENYFCAMSKLNPKIRALSFKNPIATDDERKETANHGKVFFDAVEKRLAENKWIVSAGQSIADIYFWELVEAFAVLWAPFVDSYDNIKRFRGDFEKEQWFDDFKASGRFVEKPMYPASATLNNI